MSDSGPRRGGRPPAPLCYVPQGAAGHQGGNPSRFAVVELGADPETAQGACGQHLARALLDHPARSFTVVRLN